MVRPDVSSTDPPAVVRSIASTLNVLDGDDRLRPLDSLTLIEFVAALEEATGLDLLGLPLAASNFQSVESVVALLDRARTA
jgi:acyl carrier protein